jgi:hypothetical protein
MKQSGLFGLSDHLKRLSANGDPLEELGRIVEFEGIRVILDTALAHADGAKGGRPPLSMSAPNYIWFHPGDRDHLRPRYPSFPKITSLRKPPATSPINIDTSVGENDNSPQPNNAKTNFERQ